jgi:2-polyprenyl-3-methyl-5-hydroxy-6-metoxy-1,4-benzoquinol methylase
VSSWRRRHFKMKPALRHSASLRDPAGHLLEVDGRIFRIVDPAETPQVLGFLESRQCQSLVERGKLVRTWVAAVSDMYLPRELEEYREAGVLEHERVWFPSYAHEWPAQMLHAAGRLTLDLAMELLKEGRGLKDATPYNILFRGPKPVLVDFLSVEERDPRDKVWLTYAQFVRCFLLPLLAHRTRSATTSTIFLEHRDGLEPEELFRQLSWLQKLSPAALSLVTAPVILGRAFKAEQDQSIYGARLSASQEQARYILERTFKLLDSQLDHLRPEVMTSRWSNYGEERSHYSEEERSAKLDFFSAALRSSKRRLLDIGCNTGEYSLAAARQGWSVVSIDSDEAVVGALWERAQDGNLDVLPLCVNIARPTPGLGWRNQESASFLTRCRNQFDTVALLAVLHHLTISEGIPLEEIVSLCEELKPSCIVAEFIPQKDPLFQKLLRGRGHLHQHWTPEYFEGAWHASFATESKMELKPSGRGLYQFSCRK